MVRMTEEEFETVCNILIYEDWKGWNIRIKENFTFCTLIAECDRKQIHIKIDMYGNKERRTVILFGEDGYED